MTVNERIADGAIRHMVWTERYKSSVVRKILSLLNQVDADLVEKIERRLAKISERGFDTGKVTSERLKAIANMVADEYRGGFAASYGDLKKELFNFAVYESDFQARLVEQSAAGVVTLDLARPSSAQLRAAATSRPFQGRLLRDWFSGLETAARQRVDQAVRIGIVEGETTQQIMRRIRGTRARKYRDGILEISRRNVEAVTRTAIQYVADRAAQETWQANADVIDGVMWMSTLDSKTSAICRERDRKVYEVGKAPAVPAHFNCRSRTVPYIKGISDKGLRTSAFGPVPRKRNYEQWLKSQPASVQDEVLGKAKGKLFRKGGLPLDRFQDRTGREYTLPELKQRDSEIWNKTFQE